MVATARIMPTVSLKDQCLARIEECFVIAENRYGKQIPRPRVEFSNSMSRTAGSARNGWDGVPRLIRLSSKLLQLNGQTFVDRTPGHEAAHCIAMFLWGVQEGGGHGRRWSEVMKLLGQPAERCHSMEVVRLNSVTAVCDCREHEITQRHARNVWSLRCKICKSSLRLKGEIMNTVKTEVATPVVATPAKATKTKVTIKAKVKPAAVVATVATVGDMDRAWAEGQMQSGVSFAKVCRAVVDAHLKDTEGKVDFDLLMRVCTEMEVARNKGKVRSYLRHIVTKELGLSI